MTRSPRRPRIAAGAALLLAAAWPAAPAPAEVVVSYEEPGWSDPVVKLGVEQTLQLVAEHKASVATAECDTEKRRFDWTIDRVEYGEKKGGPFNPYPYDPKKVRIEKADRTSGTADLVAEFEVAGYWLAYATCTVSWEGDECDGATENATLKSVPTALVASLKIVQKEGVDGRSGDRCR